MVGLLAVVSCLLEAQDQSELEALRRRVEELERKMAAQEPAPAEEPEVVEGLPARAQDANADAGEVYSKPFLKRFGRDVYIGGYIDIEYIAGRGADTFDQHRLVPFIYADVTDHLKMAAEIEIEHGGELGVEFAHVDYWFADWVNLRAGIILDPVGRFNLVHDAPFQDLTLRPLVNQTVAPTVLREPGIGLFGTFDSDPWKFDYEIYVVNGFKGLSKDGATVTINTSSGLKDARPHNDTIGKGYRDFNDNKAVVGRLSASPFLGFEAGVSAHTGKYDERSDNDLTITAVDWTVNLGGVMRKAGLHQDFWTAFEVVGELVRADIERDAFARGAGVPGDMDGWYLEGRYHFMPGFLRQGIPGLTDESTFTLVYRRSEIDLDGAKRAEDTLGLNFRPVEDVAFKIEYIWREESGSLSEVDNDGFAASNAAYF